MIKGEIEENSLRYKKGCSECVRDPVNRNALTGAKQWSGKAMVIGQFSDALYVALLMLGVRLVDAVETSI